MSKKQVKSSTSELIVLNLPLLDQLLQDHHLSGWLIEKETQKQGGTISRTAVSRLRKDDEIESYSILSIRVEKLIAFQKWVNTGVWKTIVNIDEYKLYKNN